MTKLKLLTSALALAALAGCAVAPGYTGPNQAKISPLKLAERLQYQGFSFARPEFGWFVSSSEQTQTHAILRRKFLSSTHSACIDIDILTLPQSASSQAEFADLCRQDRITDTTRFAVTGYHQALTKFQGEWALEYDLTMRDNGSAKEHYGMLTLSESGCIVHHPGFPNCVVRMKYCERGEPKELSSELAIAAKKFIQGVRIETTPVKLSAK